MSVQERFETKTGAKMDPKWFQNGSKMASKMDPKMNPVWDAFFEPQTGNLLPESEESESKDGKRLLMTRGPNVVDVSLQRDAFCLVRLHKKRETYKCMLFCQLLFCIEFLLT